MENDFIRKAIIKAVPKKDADFAPVIYCWVLSALQEDKLGEDGIFDLVKIARSIKEKLKRATKNKYSIYSVLDYAEFYNKIGSGNSIVFLRNYTNYVGQIQ